MQLSWKAAALASCCLAAIAAIAAVIRPRRSARVISIAAYFKEAAVILGLYAAWQVALDFAVTRTSGAVAHALWLWRVEQRLHIATEVGVQRAALAHPTLIQGLDDYYAVVHYPALIALLIWVFARHRDRYRWVRTTLILATAASIPLQAIPVAPPRLIPSLGFVDAALRFGQSVYGTSGLRDPGQLIAMPSVHVAWAALVAVAVVVTSRSRWRWLIVAHPVITALAVVATGNHFWLDGIVAVALLGGAILLQRVAVGSPSPSPAAVGRPARALPLGQEASCGPPWDGEAVRPA